MTPLKEVRALVERARALSGAPYQIPLRLSDEDVRAIVALYLSEEFRQKDIEREFCVGSSGAAKIVSAFFNDWPGRGQDHDRAALRERFYQMTGERIEPGPRPRYRSRPHWNTQQHDSRPLTTGG